MNPVTKHTEADWQEAELLDYQADLAVWREVIGLTTGPILELGCGVGRLARSLPSLTRNFFGIDRDRTMVARFNDILGRPGRRAFGQDVEAASRLLSHPELNGSRFGLILAPMLLVQTVDGTEGRRALLSSAVRALLPDGILALSVNLDLPRADCHPIPLEPDRSRAWGPLRVEPREIRCLPGGVEIIKARFAADRSEGEEFVSDFLHRLSPRQLDEDLTEANLTQFMKLTVPEDPLNQSSTIVLARPVQA